VDEVLGGDLRPQAVSSGVPFVFISVRDRSVLKRVRLNTAIWETLLSGQWAPHVYVVTQDAELQGSTLRARMFAPAMGIAEDPASGAAGAALPGYLQRRDRADDTHRWRIEQGFEMGRPSLIDVEADSSGGKIRRVRVGGGCVIVGRGEFDLGTAYES
jgi:trans-2,3-dihydro-3-hydroxyanthranilate isomerase